MPATGRRGRRAADHALGGRLLQRAGSGQAGQPGQLARHGQ
jgi:hypothetical protein